MFTGGRQRQPNHNTTTHCVYWRTVSEHNMWSCFDWVVVVVFRLLIQYLVVLWLGCRCCRPPVNTICGCIDNPIMIRRHIVFTDGRQRQPNHNTTTYCVYWRLGCRCCLPSVNTICGGIMIGLSLSSVSEHNMWSCFDCVVVVVFRLLIQYLFVLWLADGRQQRQPNHNTTTYCVYWRKTTPTTQL
jgi:hypothetical protein